MYTTRGAGGGGGVSASEQGHLNRAVVRPTAVMPSSGSEDRGEPSSLRALGEMATDIP